MKWLWALITRKLCLHCDHPLVYHDKYPSKLGPGRCSRCRCAARSPEGGERCDLPASHPHKKGHQHRVDDSLMISWSTYE